MELNKVLQKKCPTNVVAIAINNRPRAQHCGLIYTDHRTNVILCDMQWEHCLGVRTPPADYFWVRVKLSEDEVYLVSTVVDMIIAQHFGGAPIPYSTVYTRDGFDIVGRIKSGVGV